MGRLTIVLELILLLFSAVFAGTRITSGSQGNSEDLDWLAWVLFPYIAFFCVSIFIKVYGYFAKKSDFVNLMGCISALFMFFLTLLFYMDVSSTSTSCLIFIFGPIYLLLGIPVFFGISYIISKRVAKKKESKHQNWI